MKAAVVASLLGVAAASDAQAPPSTITAFCGEILEELAKDTCRLTGAPSSAVPTLESGTWTCAANGGVAAGEDNESRTVTQIQANEAAIKTAEGNLATTNSEIAGYLADIKGLNIKLAQQQIRFDAEEEALAKWKNTKVSEMTAYGRSQDEYQDHLDELETFLLDLQTLLDDDNTNTQSLAYIMKTSYETGDGTGTYNPGFYEQIKAEFETLHGNNRQEWAHMTNEKSRQTAAWNTRSTALDAMICTSMEQMDNSHIAPENAIQCPNAQSNDQNAKTQIEETETDLTTAKSDLQQAYKDQADETETVRVEKANLADLKVRLENEKKMLQERITAYQEVHAMCNFITSYPDANQHAFDVGETFANGAGAFVQLGSTRAGANPLTHVQKSLLATAEAMHNKQLALFATSMSSMTGDAGAIGKVIALVKDMIVDLQKQIDLETKGSWCENQAQQVAEAVNNANSYVDSLQQQLDKLANDISVANARQTVLNTCISESNTAIQAANADEKAWETQFLANKADLKEGIHAFEQMKAHMSNILTSDIAKQIFEKIGTFIDVYNADLRRMEADYKKALDDSADLLKQHKVNLARCESELGFVQDNLTRYTTAQDENNAAMGEAKASQDAANEMKDTFERNCETQDGLQIANGASALEKCAMTCHTVNALELACHELAGADDTEDSGINDDCVLCNAATGEANAVVKSKDGNGATSFACQTSAGGSFAPALPAACTGAELLDNESCSYTAAVGDTIYHSDVACNKDLNSVDGCDMLTSEDGGSCNPSDGVMSGGNAIAACRTETIGAGGDL